MRSTLSGGCRNDSSFFHFPPQNNVTLDGRVVPHIRQSFNYVLLQLNSLVKMTLPWKGNWGKQAINCVGFCIPFLYINTEKEEHMGLSQYHRGFFCFCF